MSTFSTVRAAGFLSLMLFIAGCGSDQASSQSTSTPQPTLIRYLSPTPTHTPRPDLNQPTETPLPVPTPTPIIYVIQENDTLIGIAVRYDVSLDDIYLANPEVDPRFLSIGTEIIIPQGEGGEAAGLPTPTPAVSVSRQPACFDTGNGGAVCLWQVDNSQPYALENVAAIIRLYNEEGQQVAHQEALMLLNVLPSGRSLPLLVNFPPPLENWSHVQAELVTAVEVYPDDPRYLLTSVEVTQVDIDRLTAHVTGQVQLADPTKTARTVWIAVVAYDVDGNPVGIRRWDSPIPIGEGDNLNFETEVYSLGPPIARIEVLVEARP